MKRICLSVFLIVVCLIWTDCSKDTTQEYTEKSQGVQNGVTYKIVIVMDTVDDWSSGIRDGFRENMIKELNKAGASGEFTEYDTQLSPDRAEEIVADIKKISPDLICMINYPTVFADTLIASRLTDPSYRIVSENCMPVRSGVIQSWDHPGGNITGVGVFIQMNSQVRLAKRIKPSLNKLVFSSWDRTSLLNTWFKEEITRVCKEEEVTLLEFKEVKHYEETISLLKQYNGRDDVFFMIGVSAFVDKDGRPLKGTEETEWVRENLNVPLISYDETTVEIGNVAGACVIWYDIGAQLAEKGLRILDGEDPGKIPWDYPRKYNIVLNKKRGDRLGIEFGEDITSAAYRIYTDYEGNYIGKEN